MKTSYLNELIEKLNLYKRNDELSKHGEDGLIELIGIKTLLSEDKCSTMVKIPTRKEIITEGRNYLEKVTYEHEYLRKIDLETFIKGAEYMCKNLKSNK